MSSVIARGTPRPPSQPAGHSPLRRPGSVRRTSSLDVIWPGGASQPMAISGRARDIHTPAAGGPPRVLADDRLVARLNGDRTILEIAAEPPRSGVATLIGQRGGGYLRLALELALPEERAAGTPLYLLIDDLSGTSLIAGWALTQWKQNLVSTQSKRATMEGVCTGFRPGSSALVVESENCQPVVPLPHPDDPAGWHELNEHEGVSMRRARRIDIWLDGVIHIDAAFQDSATRPEGGRTAVHEYRLHATADPVAQTLLSISATPHVLPFPECPAAVDNIAALIGTPLCEMRLKVLQELRRTRGCTHLNDALRALAEVPMLLWALRDQ